MGRFYTIAPGDVFGRLVVIGKVDDSINKKDGKHCARYLCKCSCTSNTTIIVKGKNLTHGITRSCGCIRKEVARNKGNNSNLQQFPVTTVNPSVVMAYYNMIYDSNFGTNTVREHIPVYGAWLGKNSTKVFYDMMNSTYQHDCKIGRLNTLGGFRPENVYWISKNSDPISRTNDKLITYNGETFTAREWNMALGYKEDTVKNRLLNGYSDTMAVTGTRRDVVPINAVYFVNEYGRPLNPEASEIFQRNLPD